jgi:signal transduction histidine kinase
VKKSPSQKTLLALNEVFVEVLALANHALQEHHITVRTEVEPSLPLVSGDRIQIQQVLLNLLINAVDAMNDTDADRRIATLRAVRQGQSDAPAVLVQVTDFGRGLKAGDVDRLFEPFYSTKSNGMGMGLLISRSIVEAHGGRLLMDANLGPSTTFSFILPATQPAHLETERMHRRVNARGG